MLHVASVRAADWGLGDPLSKWLTHTTGTLVLAVSGSSAGTEGWEPSDSLHAVPSLCLGFLTAWWFIPRASIIRERGRQKLYVFYGPALEVTQHHFCCSVLIEVSSEAQSVQGNRARLHLLMGEWQGSRGACGTGNIVVACIGLNSVLPKFMSTHTWECDLT